MNLTEYEALPLRCLDLPHNIVKFFSWKCQDMCSRNLPRISETILILQPAEPTIHSETKICQGRQDALY